MGLPTVGGGVRPPPPNQKSKRYASYWNAFLFSKRLRCCYCPQTKLRKGNVFTSVCQEFCPQGGSRPRPRGCLPRGGAVQAQGGVSQHALRQTPPPSRRLLLQTVCILLECILVLNLNLYLKKWAFSRLLYQKLNLSFQPNLIRVPTFFIP